MKRNKQPEQLFTIKVTERHNPKTGRTSRYIQLPDMDKHLIHKEDVPIVMGMIRKQDYFRHWFDKGILAGSYRAYVTHVNYLALSHKFK